MNSVINKETSMEGVVPPTGTVQFGSSAKKPIALYVVAGILLVAAVAGWAMYVLELKKGPQIVEKEVVKDVPVAVAPAVVDGKQAVAPVEKVFAGDPVALPDPFSKGKMSVEEAIITRRSRRTFADRPVNLKELSQILSSAQGITDKTTGKRAAPSAFETYPVDVYVVARRVEGLKPGVYLYRPQGNVVQAVKYGEMFLMDEKMQGAVKDAPVVIVYGAVFARMQAKVPDLTEAKKYTYQEVGHIVQNAYLATEGFGMATVTTVGFDDAAVRAELGIGNDTELISLEPFGGRAQ